MTTRFIAVAGYVDRPTLDNRILCRWDKQDRSLPMPVLNMPEPDHQLYGAMGRIDHVGLLGDQIILTGILLEDWLESDAVRGLRKGSQWMNLDVDFPGRSMGDMTAGRGWRIRAATVHGNPVWELPPVMIWTEN